MNHLKFFESIDFNNRVAKPIVSFDFDGVLHRSVIPNTIHPLCRNEPRKWEPRFEVFDEIEYEDENNDVIVVTARRYLDKPILWEFINHFGLPISAIYCTGGKSKYPIFKKLGVVKHYDDNPTMAKKLESMNIEFVLSVPEYMSDYECDSLIYSKRMLW